jgi:LysR family cys regulon transcriptional activator
MKLRQLQYLWEVHRHGNNMSAAATALHTSQPGISKQIQQIESEIGFEVFSRQRNRIVGLTVPGREAVAIAQRSLGDVERLKSLGGDFKSRSRGSLTIATTHTIARYVLPKAIDKFVRQYPDVRVGLRQGTPTNVCEMVEAGEADIGIGSETSRTFPSLTAIPCLTLPRCIVAKANHPLFRIKRLQLAQISKYPIITYDPAYSGRWKVLEAFRKAGLEPNIVFGAVDADVSKTYVGLGMGIAILTAVSFDAGQDKGLRSRDASHLFEPSTIYIRFRTDNYLPDFALDFLKRVSPEADFGSIRTAR